MARIINHTSTMTTPNLPTYLVTTIIDAPYVVMKEGGGYDGFLIDVLNGVADKVGFRYTIRPRSDGVYGSQQADGSWNGLVGELMRHDADIAVANLAITESRERVIEFSKPVFNEGVRLLTKKPETPVPGLGLLVEPFATEQWFAILIAFLLVSILFIIIGRYSPYEWTHVAPGKDPRGARHSFGLRDSFMFTFSTLTWQGYREHPRSLSGRILAAFWFMFAIFSILAYTANLTVFLLAREEAKPVMPFKNYHDLVQDGKIDVGVVKDGFTIERLRNAQSYKHLADYIESRQTYVDSVDSGVRRVKSDREFVMLMESSKADFYTTYNCDLMVYGNTLFIYGIGFAMPLNSRLRDHISKAVLEMLQDGIIRELHVKWWDRRRCGKYEEEQAKFDKKRELPFKAFAVNPRDMAVAFLLLMVGIIAAVVFLIVENIVSRMRTTKFAPGSVQARTHTEDRITGDRIERFSADGDTKPDSGDGARGQP